MLRTKIASKFGKAEHVFGEFLGLYLLLVAYSEGGAEHYVAFALWLLYFISHRLEKWFYGQYGPRSSSQVTRYVRVN